MNEEHKRKISQAMKVLWANPQGRVKMAEGQQRRWQNPANRAQMSRALKRRWNESREIISKKISESLTGKPKSAIHKEAICKGMIRAREKKQWDAFQNEGKVGVQHPNYRGGREHYNAGQRVYQREWRVTNRIKYLARLEVQKALRSGVLVKPNVCERCYLHDEVCGPLDCHHESYALDQWLVVQWLCNSCHKRRHWEIEDQHGGCTPRRE